MFFVPTSFQSLLFPSSPCMPQIHLLFLKYKYFHLLLIASSDLLLLLLLLFFFVNFRAQLVNKWWLEHVWASRDKITINYGAEFTKNKPFFSGWVKSLPSVKALSVQVPRIVPQCASLIPKCSNLSILRLTFNQEQLETIITALPPTIKKFCAKLGTTYVKALKIIEILQKMPRLTEFVWIDNIRHDDADEIFKYIAESMPQLQLLALRGSTPSFFFLKLNSQPILTNFIVDDWSALKNHPNLRQLFVHSEDIDDWESYTDLEHFDDMVALHRAMNPVGVGLNLNIWHKDGFTCPVIAAIAENNLECLRRLITDQKVDVNEPIFADYEDVTIGLDPPILAAIRIFRNRSVGRVSPRFGTESNCF